jgi:hypothetical protein
LSGAISGSTNVTKPLRSVDVPSLQTPPV